MCEDGACRGMATNQGVFYNHRAGVVYSFSVLKRKIISRKEEAFLDKEFHRSPALIDLFSFTLLKIGRVI